MEEEKQIKIGNVTLHIEQLDECKGCPYMDVNTKEFYSADGLAYIDMQCSMYSICSRMKKLLRQ